MANSENQVELKLNLDVSGVQSALYDMIGDFTGTGKEFDKITKKIEQSFKNLEAVIKRFGANSKEAESAMKSYQKTLTSLVANGVDPMSPSFLKLQNAVNGSTTAINNAGNSVKKTNMTFTNLALVIQDLPYGFRGIQNNLPALVGSFAAATGAIYLAVSVVIAAITAWDMGLFKTKETTDELKKSQEDFAKTLLSAQGSALEAGVKLKKYIQIAEDSTVSEVRRKEALNAVKQEITKVDANIGASITTLAKAKKAVEQYTESLIQNAVVTTYTQRAADLTVQQTDAQKKLNAEYQKFTAIAKKYGVTVNMTNEELLNKAYRKDNFLARISGDGLDAAVNNLITINGLLNDTNKDLDKSLNLALQNPLFKLGEPDKTAGADNTFSSNLRKENNLILIEIKKRAELLKKYNGGFIEQETPQEKANAEKKRKSDLKNFADYKMTGEFGESLQGAKSSFFESLNPEKREAENEVIVAQNKSINEQADAYLRLADSISNYATNAFIGLWNAMEQGASIGEALKMMFIDLVKQIAAAAVKALIFSIVLSFLPTSGAGAVAATVAKSKAGGFGDLLKTFMGFANGGIVSGPTMGLIGEYPGAKSNPEVVAPLNKLKDLMADSGGGGEFIIRGQDLVLAMNRSETALKYRRG